jgi:hypothetical protein
VVDVRFPLRKALALGAALTLLAVGLPAAAHSEDDPRSCNDLLGDDTPAYVVCRWLATPEEARDIALFWLSNDGEELKRAEPYQGPVVDCRAEGNVCDPGDSEGDGTVGDETTPVPEGADTEGGTPECDPPGSVCAVGPDDVQVTPAEVKAAAEGEEGRIVTSAAQAGMRVWLDTELADDWKAGKEKFTAAVKRVAALAAREDVTGIRFSTQLGYNGTFQSAEEITSFVGATSAALRRAAPGKKLAVHTLVPELACGSNEACRTEMRAKHPLLAPDQVQTYLASGAVDQLTLDSGLMRTGYATWKITLAEAQRNQWIQVRARAWDAFGHIAAEDAGFADPGGSTFTAQQATEAVKQRISQPLMDDGAETVTLWTRWQDEKGQVHRVLGDALATTPTWETLGKLHAVRPRLATIYNSTTPEVDPATDLKKLAEVFGQVYLQIP